MKRALLSGLVLTFVAGAAVAETPAEQITRQLQDQGFTRIEIDTSPRVIEVEAYRGTTELGLSYDARTGALTRSEQSRASADDDLRPGVFVNGVDIGAADASPVRSFWDGDENNDHGDYFGNGRDFERDADHDYVNDDDGDDDWS